MEEKENDNTNRRIRWTFTDGARNHAVNPQRVEQLRNEIAFKRIVFQEEETKGGYRHLQGYFELYKRRSFNYIQEAWGFTHLEIAKGTPWENYTYCTKPDTQTGRYGYVRGIFPEPCSSKRKKNPEDFDELVEDCKEHDERFIARKYPRYFLRHCNGIPRLINHWKDPAGNRQIVVIALIGNTGTGKSHWGRQYAAWHHKTIYCKGVQDATGTPWFNGYEGQSVLLLDDFNSNQLEFRFLLTMLDIYPLKVQTKNGYVDAMWDTVIITSNSSILQWYERQNTAPLQRRIHFTFQCIENYVVDYVPYQHLYEGVTDPVQYEVPMAPVPDIPQHQPSQEFDVIDLLSTTEEEEFIPETEDDLF